MNNFSATEIKVLNWLSTLRNRSVLLGTIIDNIVSMLPSYGTPVNAVNASTTLTFTGVVVHGETLTIDRPGIPGSAVYEMLADEEQIKSNPSNFAVDITDYADKARVYLTVDTQPTSGDTMTIGGKVYTFVPDGTDTADGEVSVGTDLASAKLNIVAAINGTDEFNSANQLVNAAEFSSDSTVISAIIGGTSGNGIGSTETFTAVTNVFSDTVLGAGTDCSADNAVTALVASCTAHNTQAVYAADGAGSTVVFTSAIPGADGNAISISETFANGSLTDDETHLTGGVDGTVGGVGKIMVDDSYIYFAISENTTAGKNWRRITIGAAY